MPIDLNSLSPRAQAARAFAIEAHGEQRYGKHPYIVHLDAVVEQILRFEPGAGQDTIAAGFLHDVVEDTSVTVEQVMERFGSRVAELVHAVTTEPGATRKERHAATWPKLVETEGAVRLKLADHRQRPPRLLGGAQQAPVHVPPGIRTIPRRPAHQRPRRRAGDVAGARRAHGLGLIGPPEAGLRLGRE